MDIALLTHGQKRATNWTKMAINLKYVYYFNQEETVAAQGFCFIQGGPKLGIQWFFFTGVVNDGREFKYRTKKVDF